MSKSFGEQTVGYAISYADIEAKNRHKRGEDDSYEIRVLLSTGQNIVGTVDSYAMITGRDVFRFNVVNENTGNREPVFVNFDHIVAASVNWI